MTTQPLFSKITIEKDLIELKIKKSRLVAKI